jgi:hypothetical protein
MMRSFLVSFSARQAIAAVALLVVFGAADLGLQRTLAAWPS